MLHLAAHLGIIAMFLQSLDRRLADRRSRLRQCRFRHSQPSLTPLKGSISGLQCHSDCRAERRWPEPIDALLTLRRSEMVALGRESSRQFIGGFCFQERYFGF